LLLCANDLGFGARSANFLSLLEPEHRGQRGQTFPQSHLKIFIPVLPAQAPDGRDLLALLASISMLWTKLVPSSPRCFLNSQPARYCASSIRRRA
jgi:hypothetical protein